MSAFDPATFMDATIDQALDTKIIPIKSGEYPGVAAKVETRGWTGKADPTKSGVALDVTWELESPEQTTATGREKLNVRQSIMLDITEQGGLDVGKGKNVRLGALRDALGLNVAGQPFNFRMIEGRRAKVKVGQRVDGQQIFNDVDGVTKL